MKMKISDSGSKTWLELRGTVGEIWGPRKGLHSVSSSYPSLCLNTRGREGKWGDGGRFFGRSFLVIPYRGKGSWEETGIQKGVTEEIEEH